MRKVLLLIDYNGELTSSHSCIQDRSHYIIGSYGNTCII